MSEGLKLVNDIWAWVQKEHPEIAELKGCYITINLMVLLLSEPNGEGLEFYKRLKNFIEGEVKDE